MIAKVQLSMDENVQSMEAYAKANGHELSALKAAGLAKKAVRIQASAPATTASSKA
jgi:hypothetical protein